MGNEGPLLTCMEVEVVGAVWMVDVVPGRLVTVNAGFNVSCKRRSSKKNQSKWNLCLHPAKTELQSPYSIQILRENIRRVQWVSEPKVEIQFLISISDQHSPIIGTANL